MRRALAVLALSAAATACGTTVAVDGTGATGGGDLGLPTGPRQTEQQPGLTGGPAAPSGATRVTPSGQRTGVGVTTTGGARASTSPASPTRRAAATGAPVKVGVLYIDGAEEAFTALGVSGLATGDARAQAAAVIGWVNAHGGLAGRRVVATYVGIKAADAVNNPQLAQERACQQLTQDAKVAFVVSYVNLLPATMHCFAKGGAAMVNDQSALTDEVIRRYDRVFAAPGDFAPGRMLRELVDALWRTGWLTSTSVVGAYHYDQPESSRLVKQALEPALARYGLRLARTAAVSGSADGISQNSGVVVQFRSAGVDRVIPVLANPLFLMQAASSQGYRPQYALYSLFGPGALMESAAPRDQLTGSAGIGWSPYLDIGAGTKAPPVSANETLCFDIYAKAGQSSSARTAKGLQLQLCNVILYLKYAADRIGGAPPDLLFAARRPVGTTFRPADTFRSDVSSRADGAAGYRDLAFREDCSCYQYTSPIRLTTNGSR